MVAVADETRWLSIDQIRRQQRLRWQTVAAAMECGDLPFEKRGRVRYARLPDIYEWEQQRLNGNTSSEGLIQVEIPADWAHLLQ